MNLRRAVTMLAALVILGLAVAAMPSAKAQKLTTLHSFHSTDGAGPSAGLVQGGDGNYYGATAFNGANNGGTVFKITPSGALSTLYNFCSQGGSNCTDGSMPFAGLVQGSDGNLYGTTAHGGANNAGTVFKITPGGVLTTLYSFCSQSGCTDGENPSAGLVQASDGNFYGTTAIGGANGNYGTVFKITPGGALTTLYSFCPQGSPCPDGSIPEAALVQGSDGNFYGTTKDLGAHGGGTVFKITSGGALNTLYSFCSQGGSSCTDGENPYAGLVQGSDGNFYGTTAFGGANNGYPSFGGTVFKITPGGTLSTLYSFCAQTGCTDGSLPFAVLVQGSDGNFYGTTFNGGANGNYGTVFKITPGGALTTLYAFCSVYLCEDGENPWAGLVQGTDGNFYGTTYEGGASSPNYGTVFKLSLVPVASVSPASLAFGSQLVGTTSLPRPVTLSNTGYVPLTISSIGPPIGDFGDTHNCPISPATLAAGATCTINVTFTPTGIGTWNGGVTITDDSNGVPGSQQGVFLTGSGINPGGTVSPISLPFGNQVINTTSRVKKVTLTSTGTTNLMNIRITITGANAGDFTQSNNCPATLNLGTKCQISVTYTPSVLGNEAAALDVSDNAANSPQTVSLTGKGVPQATVSPTSLTFAGQKVGTTSVAKNVTLTNNMSTALTSISITLGGADPGDFTVSSTTCGTSLAAKAHCTISTEFTPTAIGARTATLNVNDSANNSPQTVSLTGTGK